MPAPELEPLVAWGRALGFRGEPQDTTRRPWSTTTRLDGVWLKACSPAAAYEAALLGALRRWGARSVVLPLAVDVDRGLIALPDGGVRLRELGGGTARWPSALAEHAALQRSLEHRAADLLALGVPDLRARTVPDQLGALVDRAAPPEEVRRSLTRVLPAVAEDCAALVSGPVGPSLQHDDLHDGNVLVDAAGTARLIDWGDSVVAHPFGVLLVTLRALRHRYGITDREADRLLDAYLEAWSDRADRRSLRELADAAQRVQPVGRALAWERALRAADDAERAEYGDPVTGWLEVLAGLED